MAVFRRFGDRVFAGLGSRGVAVVKVLITGGVKSGKSSFAEQRTLELAGGETPIYLATTELLDNGMRERIAVHRQRRGEQFRTIEEPLHLTNALKIPPIPPLPKEGVEGISASGKGETPENLGIAGKPATLLAEALGLSGRSYALDAACASSLYSIGLACHTLWSERSDLMLAGAVSAADPFFVNMGFTMIIVWWLSHQIRHRISESMQNLNKLS